MNYWRRDNLKKNLVQHCEHVEAESRELQEFLQVRSKIQKH